jgi:NAD(P)-dependent dehydrogenase (short-subunit alcohol dehydrogenase family)
MADAALSKAQAAQAKGDTKGALEAAREALKAFHTDGNAEGEAKAKEICAACRPKSLRQAPPASTQSVVPVFPIKKATYSCVPGITAPCSVKAQNVIDCFRISGSCELKRLSGMVAVVTGASRGIGKGLAEILALDGAVVYVTGRSSPGKVTDVLLMGTVDETAASFAKLGGIGVATHVDHAQDSQNKALTSLIETNHGRCDVLVNNAFYIPKPDLIFFNTPLWLQPIRFLNEQTAVGGFNHAAQTLLFCAALRRGKGVVINISSWGSQLNIGIFPVSYLCNKAAFDRTIAALSEKLRNYNVHVLTLWPGSVKSERSIMGAKRSGAKLIDLETVRFTGYAVVGIATQPAEMLSRWSSYHRVLSCADVATFETDGYMHQGDIHSYTAGGRTPFKELCK